MRVAPLRACLTCRRPVYGRNEVRPSAMLLASTPAAWAAAAAASALRTLCRPGIESVACASPCGVRNRSSLESGLMAWLSVTFAPASMPEAIPRGAPARRRAQPQLAGERLDGMACRYLRSRVHAEVDHAARSRAAAKEFGLRVVRVHAGDSVRRQRVVDRGVLGRDFLDRVHELKMLALRVVDERNAGPRDVGEISDLALVVHAELDRAPAVPLPDRKSTR